MSSSASHPPLLPQPHAMRETLQMARRLIDLGKTWTLNEANRAIGVQALAEAEEHVERVLEALARMEGR